MLDFMKFYIFHKNGFRVAFAMNSAASNIWTAWLCAFMCIAGGLIRLVAEGITDDSSYLLITIGLVIFISSYHFLPEAKRIHKIRETAKNEILFGD
jgi:hypothetical protein